MQSVDNKSNTIIAIIPLHTDTVLTKTVQNKSGAPRTQVADFQHQQLPIASQTKLVASRNNSIAKPRRNEVRCPTMATNEVAGHPKTRVPATQDFNSRDVSHSKGQLFTNTKVKKMSTKSMPAEKWNKMWC